ncbi:MAG: hypothetical protein H6718_01085 [Polyangiaceae bacterium]|nr:hypothetical protein [Polyangiaceae bacterium]MCB9607788.1 hypothetical protein [Polyangiaceae bacterium]
MRKTTKKTMRRLLVGLTAGLALAAVGEQTASAQEILLTGPLAGAPAVRKLRLYREGRIEVAPAISFTLLDEYQRTMLFGARINYNFTDWLALGVWGGFGGLKLNTGLTDRVQDVNAERRTQEQARTDAGLGPSVSRRLTATNMGPKFEDQIGTIDWIAAPQITAVPFRGKLALFQNIYLDTDLYFFAGPAFIGVSERKECDPDAGTPCQGSNLDDKTPYERESRVAIAPTFGLGFTFYVNKWNAIGFEWRGIPFARNTGGFDNHGGGPDSKFPDQKVNADDRDFKFNQMLTLSYNFYFPQQYRVSE